jgi:hypothetical protein
MPTVVPATVGCPAHRWVHGPIRFLNTLFNRLFERSNTSRSCYRPGAKMGSHSAKSRQESGGVWTVICPGKQHFVNLLDSSRPVRGLLHTEEVTGSIPVSPTDVRPAQRLHGQLSSYAPDAGCRRIGRNLGDRHLARRLGPCPWSRGVRRCGCRFRRSPTGRDRGGRARGGRVIYSAGPLAGRGGGRGSRSPARCLRGLVLLGAVAAGAVLAAGEPLGPLGLVLLAGGRGGPRRAGRRRG